ncbi:MAG: hypothetical protein RAP03_11665 [Candidatus Electryonea clarkiae]|nr:hypothetical protein [Candidatus Electryonea clarkiae]
MNIPDIKSANNNIKMAYEQFEVLMREFYKNVPFIKEIINTEDKLEDTSEKAYIRSLLDNVSDKILSIDNKIDDILNNKILLSDIDIIVKLINRIVESITTTDIDIINITKHWNIINLESSLFGIIGNRVG